MHVEKHKYFLVVESVYAFAMYFMVPFALVCNFNVNVDAVEAYILNQHPSFSW